MACIYSGHSKAPLYGNGSIQRGLLLIWGIQWDCEAKAFDLGPKKRTGWKAASDFQNIERRLFHTEGLLAV